MKPAHRPRPAAARPTRRAGRGGTLLGIFLGVIIGLALAAGVAFYLLRAGNPYQAAAPSRDAAREPAKAARADAGAEKPRFDFYKILPGNEEPKVAAKPAERPAPDKATVERAAAPDKAPEKVAMKKDERAPAEPSRAPKAAEKFWLQAGSFAAEPDAESLKARLALAGWEAEVQTATVADKGVRYRVRLGPYDNTDELNRIKTELGKRGFDVAVIRY